MSQRKPAKRPSGAGESPTCQTNFAAQDLKEALRLIRVARTAVRKIRRKAQTDQRNWTVTGLTQLIADGQDAYADIKNLEKDLSRTDPRWRKVRGTNEWVWK